MNSAQPSELHGEACRALPDPSLEFTLDRDWRITSITDSAAAWAGSTVTELLGRDGHEINPAATRLLAEPLAKAFSDGLTSTLEQPSTHVPGRWVRVEVAPVEDGARVRFEDITPRARPLGGDHDAELAAEIALLDGRGVIVSVNAAWRAGIVALGLELADLGVGARYADVAKAIVPSTDEVAFQSRLDELFSGKVAQFEARFSQATPDGAKRRQVQIAPLRLGPAVYFIAIHEDLTERAKVLAALHETSDRLLHAQEQERQRIAIELHDSMSQHLAGLTLGLMNLRRRIGENAGAQALIDEMSELTQRAVHETRVLSYLMNASGEELESLEVAVDRFVGGFARRAGLEAITEVHGPVNAVPAAVRHAVFRVVQEAVSNVHRHAQASRLQVSLARRAGVLTVRITDDGKGFQLAKDPKASMGVGIMGMRTRIEQLGGSLEIDGSGGGTVVSATIPAPSRRRKRPHSPARPANASASRMNAFGRLRP
jgi:signal transduction histidine kinase